MINPVLKWALQILQQSEETSVNKSVSKALKLVGIDSDQIQINCQPLESIFSAIVPDDESSINEKQIGWQELDVQQIVYPAEQADKVLLNISEPPGGWDRFYGNANLALALIEKYGTFLSISPQVPHISFYDAVKSAAAIQDCLECGKTDKPFLLVSGDFSGIQDAIYTIASSGALKTLRARSFMLELLTEHIIYEIQQAIGYGRYSLIFSGGGGFSLLVPNIEENQKAINNFAKVINSWILEQFSLQLFLALHCEPVNADAIEGNQFKDTYELMADKLDKQKQRKFWDNSDDNSNFKSLFSPKMPKQLANQDACQITHRDDFPDCEMAPEDLPGIGRVSKLAYRLWKLGDRLTEFKCIVRLHSLEDDLEDGTLIFPTHGGQYAEYKVINHLPQVNNYDALWLVNSWDLTTYKNNKTFSFLFGNYVRSVAELPQAAHLLEIEEYQKAHSKEMDNPRGTTASFSGLAKAAQGSDFIGCLRMDVDDFGDLFSGELTGSGIAAISNLSRSMNLFFKGYLNQICGLELGDLGKKNHPLNITGECKSNGRDVSIVYAGGDDLFIVGAWDDIAELAFDINACFDAFSCYNPDIHLSGGVTLHKPKFPLYQMARMAKQAEEAAKINEKQIGETKNSLALFYSTDLTRRNTLLNERIIEENLSGWKQKLNRIAVASQWDEHDDLIQLTKQMYKAYPYLSHGFCRKLFETLRIWQEEGLLYLPTMFRTKRHFEHIQPPIPELAELKTLLFQENLVRKLHIPLHWVEYLSRSADGGN